jgi:hypothetical protein
MRIFRLLRLGVSRFWIGVVVVIGSISGIIVVLTCLFGVPIMQAVTAVGSVSTAVGVFLALLTLRATHEWNRRHYTIEFLGDWNERARKHLVVIEKQFPEFFAVPDFIKNPDLMDSWRLDPNRAKQLVKVKSEHHEPDHTQPDIRGHLIELLNYFEGIASAYEQHVVDRAAIEDSVGTVILDVCVYFQPFIEEMRKINRRDPWPPLSRVVELWLTEATRRTAQTQAEEASRRHGEALKKFESKLKQPTGI